MSRNTKSMLTKLLCLALVIATCVSVLAACSPVEETSTDGSTAAPEPTDPPHEHTYTWHEEVPATCLANGKKAHFKCDDCGKYFDADKNEVTAASLAIEGKHNFQNYVCSACQLDLSALAAKIDALPESNYTLADIAAINTVKSEYDALTDSAKEGLTNSTRLTNAVAAISGVWVAADASTLASGGQCDQSIQNLVFTASTETGLGSVATVSYDAWQWANYRYASTEKIAVGTKVALGVYNPTSEAKGMHWGDGATVYTNSDQVTLQPGWNMITFTWEWDENAIGENYVIATHIYALSPVGSGTNMTGWKFTALYAYSDSDVFNALAGNSVNVPIQGAHVHSYVHHEKVNATCTEDGMVEHYTCECGKYFDANKAPKTQADLVIDKGHKFESGVCSGCGLNVAAIIESIDDLSLKNLASVVAQYNALPESDKALITNAYKLQAFANLITVSADTLTNDSSCGSAVTFTAGEDETYGVYGELDHTASWANVYYNSSVELQGLTKDLVVYIYNPTESDVNIAFGYTNDSQNQSIFKNECYTYATLTARAWTKVVIEWSDAYDYYMSTGFIRMVASTGGTTTAGNSTNLTAFKMSSMYIVDDAACLDELTSDTNAVQATIDAIDGLTLANVATNLQGVLARYNALSEAEKALVTNASKLTALQGLTVISADTLTNDSSCGSAVTFTAGEDETYGAYGELNHTASWANVYYNSSVELQGLTKDLVVYIYNPTESDVNIAFGYTNDSQNQSIFKNECYTYATLTARAWTKVVIEWSDAYDYYMSTGFIRMVASTGGTTTAGNSTNLTAFKMSSMYIVDDDAALDALIPSND